ncbi:MAG: hypothetical protein ACRDRH_25360 [Pseudonocardia sp.]
MRLLLLARTVGGIAALTVATRLEQPQPLFAALDAFITRTGLPTLVALSDVLPAAFQHGAGVDQFAYRRGPGYPTP